QKDELTAALAQFWSQPANIPDLASLDEQIEVSGTDQRTINRQTHYGTWKLTLTWRDLFALIAPYLDQYPSNEQVKIILRDDLYKKSDRGYYVPQLDDQIFQTIRIQFEAYN